jgi:hypothetical protein
MREWTHSTISALKMDTVCFSETLASTEESTRRRNPEEQNHHPHRRENLKSHLVPDVFFYLIFS